MIEISQYFSPIGDILIASEEQKLVGVWLKDQPWPFALTKEETQKNDKNPTILQAKRWLDDYFSGKKPSIQELEFSFHGSAFQLEVWKILCEIPYGTTVTYHEIALQIAHKRNIKQMSAQAVGGAVGRNPIAIIIPCHRVVGAKGNLTGYAGGLDRKIKLLEIEGISFEHLYDPREKKRAQKKKK